MHRIFDPESGPLWAHDLLWLAIVIALVVGVILIVRTVLARPHIWGARGSNAPPWQTQPPALHELDLRYARGEVDRVEYLQRRADLLGHPSPDNPEPQRPA
jgi:putative membrane protein